MRVSSLFSRSISKSVRLGLVVSLIKPSAINLLEASWMLASLPYMSSIRLLVFSKNVELSDTASSSLALSSQRSSSVSVKYTNIQNDVIMLSVVVPIV